MRMKWKKTQTFTQEEQAAMVGKWLLLIITELITHVLQRVQRSINRLTLARGGSNKRLSSEHHQSHRPQVMLGHCQSNTFLLSISPATSSKNNKSYWVRTTALAFPWLLPCMEEHSTGPVTKTVSKPVRQERMLSFVNAFLGSKLLRDPSFVAGHLITLWNPLLCSLLEKLLLVVVWFSLSKRL